MTLKEGKKEWMGKGQEITCLFFILYGMSFCMESILGFSIPAHLRLVSAAALAAAAELMAGTWRRTLAGVFLFLGVLAWIWVKNQEIMQAAARETANRILELINQYHRTDFLYWYMEGSSKGYGWMALMVLWALCGILEGVLALKLRDSRWQLKAALVFPALIIIAGLMVGKTVSVVGIFLMLTGILVDILDIRQRGTALLLAGIGFCLALSLWISGSLVLWSRIEVWHQDWLKRQLALEDKMLDMLEQAGNFSLFSPSGQKEYELSNDTPVQTGKKMFEITVDYPVSQNIYIRGFVGGAYDSGIWQSVSRQEFSDWAKQQGGSEQEYSRIVQSFPYEFLEYGTEIFYLPVGKKKQVSMEITGDVRGYTLMPYFTRISKEQPVKADGSFPSVKGQKFHWDSYLSLRDSEVEEAKFPVLDAFVTDKDTLANHRIWTAYEEYARRTYTMLPEKGLEDMKNYVQKRRGKEKKIYKKYMKKITEQAASQEEWVPTEEEEELLAASDQERSIQMIQKILWDNGSYSFDLLPVPEGEDYAEYFLFTQHKGYCVHFATAATLLFRMNRIPARFVSGYLILPSDFKKNNDGTWTAEVTDERAHAWTEVYGHNIGFYPVEVTPPSYTELLTELEEGEGVVQAVERKERAEHGETHEDGSQEEENQPQQEEQKEEQKREGQDKIVTGSDGTGKNETERFWLNWAGAAVGVLGLYVLFRRCRTQAWKRRQERISQKDRAQAVREIGKELYQLLKKQGYGDKDRRTDREYQCSLEQELPEYDWSQAFFIFQKAAFSEHGVTEEEYQTVLSLYHAIERKNNKICT